MFSSCLFLGRNGLGRNILTEKAGGGDTIFGFPSRFKLGEFNYGCKRTGVTSSVGPVAVFDSGGRVPAFGADRVRADVLFRLVLRCKAVGDDARAYTRVRDVDVGTLFRGAGRPRSQQKSKAAYVDGIFGNRFGRSRRCGGYADGVGRPYGPRGGPDRHSAAFVLSRAHLRHAAVRGLFRGCDLLPQTRR